MKKGEKKEEREGFILQQLFLPPSLLILFLDSEFMIST